MCIKEDVLSDMLKETNVSLCKSLSTLINLLFPKNVSIPENLIYFIKM